MVLLQQLDKKKFDICTRPLLKPLLRDSPWDGWDVSLHYNTPCLPMFLVCFDSGSLDWKDRCTKSVSKNTRQTKQHLGKTILICCLHWQ